MRQFSPSSISAVSRRSAASLGFTLIELLIVIAVIGIMAAAALAVMPRVFVARDLDSAADRVVDSLRRAQANVMTGRDFTRWGVRLEAGRVTVFSGPTYGARAVGSDETVVLGGNGHISSVSLSSGACSLSSVTDACDVHFAQVEGVPSESGDVVLRDDQGDAVTVTVNAAGLISRD